MPKATAQMKAGKTLAERDRLFQICLKYQQDNFGSRPAGAIARGGGPLDALPRVRRALPVPTPDAVVVQH
jgi:hypothetical protein